METIRQPSAQITPGSGINEIRPGESSSEQLSLKFQVPRGKVASIMGLMNLLQSKFNILEISISAKDGSISQQEIEDKIEETFRQLNIRFDMDK